MATAAPERDYWIDPADADRKGFWIFAHLLLFVVALFVVAFVIWADNAILDEVTRGQARVIPSSQVQVIQNLEGGILADVLVSEGDVVDRDEVLLRIDNTRAESDLRDLRQRYRNSLVVVTRLEAEIAGKQPNEIVFPEELVREAPELVAAELANAQVRRSQLDSQLAILRDQIAQREQELTELASKLKNLKQSLGLTAEELRIMRPLAAEGIVSKVDMLQKEREINDLQSEIDATSLARPRAESALQEASNRLHEREVTFRTDASMELGKQRVELASVSAQLTTNQDRVTRTEVRSPVHGTIKEIKIRTIGGVIQPGQDLLEIVPIEDTLLVEAQIRTSDIAFIRPEQSAVVKIDTYDFSIYGGLDAVVEQISPDAIEDEVNGKRERFFRIRLRTGRNFLGTEAKPLPISPGMTATVDILTGHKTVLDYLLKPILRARDTAMRER